ncbi:MAG: hypothetical protein NTX59_00495 [Elusimicrobia bacterium]|nr:hypothetical protein [Elusimicrobiota bacterium]
MKKILPIAGLVMAAGLLLRVNGSAAEARISALDQLDGSVSGVPVPSPASPAPEQPPVGVVTVYAYPPTFKQDWSSPRGMLGSMLSSDLKKQLYSTKTGFVSDFNEEGTVDDNYKSAVGHVEAHVKCTLPEGGVYDVWTGMVGRKMMSADIDVLVNKKLGMGSMFHAFVDGYLANGEENIWRLVNYKSSGRDIPRYWEQEIDSQACGKIKEMVGFYSGFHYKPGTTLAQLQALPPEKIFYFDTTKDPYNTYMARRANGDNTPVGGVCASYGMALLKMAGKYDYSIDDQFRSNIEVSERLIGGIPDETGKIREVELSDLVFGSLGGSWTYPGYKNRLYNSYDPQHIWQFIGEVGDCAWGGPLCTLAASEWYNKNKSRVVYATQHAAELLPYAHADREIPVGFRMEGIHVK